MHFAKEMNIQYTLNEDLIQFKVFLYFQSLFIIIHHNCVTNKLMKKNTFFKAGIIIFLAGAAFAAPQSQNEVMVQNKQGGRLTEFVLYIFFLNITFFDD